MSGCRGPVEKGDETPRIGVWCVGDVPEHLPALEHGIEEERVSWVVRSEMGGDVVSVAYEAASDSALRVGVGVDGDRYVVHHQRLPRDDPLFDVRADDARARTVGSNAARLAKRMPFKPVD
ncbi:glycerol dehydratase reactivase beta/small subunit family protein [Halomarina ordinaria]|uniref:Glycerol dehydratase reactivase beta/small subunit family protein n=1 Tax=Halomarina ordinaria TaxID=3033939 RepID=A0ABD5UBL0_9EURY|nr:glycerol dehydratase reactivase beta/small subunit family protein [Halomarina sp. PSRA2]